MPKSKEYRLARDVAGLAEVERRAGDFAGYQSAFPQEVRLKPRPGKLPRLGDAPGFTLIYFVARAELDAAKASAEALAGMLEGLLGVRPAPSIDCSATFRLPGGAGALKRCQDSRIEATIDSDGEYSFDLSVGGVVVPEGGRAKLESRYAAERVYMEEINGRAIEAGRLPLRIYSTGRSFEVEATGGSRLHQTFSSEHYGTHYFRCSLPESSPRDLARRLFDVLGAMPGAEPLGYACRFQYHDRKTPGRCRAAYTFARSQKWPVTSFEAEALFRLESAESLGGLLPEFIGPRGVRLPLGEFTLGSKRKVKLLVIAKGAGHQLILQLPPEDEGRLAEIEGTLGVTFAG